MNDIKKWIILSIIALVASTDKSKGLKIEWHHITILSVVAFLAGWLLFGLLGAIILAIVVMILMGIIKVN